LTELVKIAVEAIQKTRKELGNKPEEANQLIDFLNNTNRYQLDALDIEDRTTISLKLRKFLLIGT